MTRHERFDAEATPVYRDDVYLRKGDAVVIHGKSYVVQSRCSDPVGYIVEDPLAPDGGRALSSANIKAWHSKGELTFVAREHDDPGVPIGVRRNLRRDLAGFSKQERTEMVRRTRYCMALDALGQGFSRSEQALQPICDRIAEERGDEGSHDWATVYRWWKLWVRSGRDPRALAPRHREKGNRDRRTADGIEDLAQDVIRKWYLRPGARQQRTCHDAFFAALVERYGSAEKVWAAHAEAAAKGRVLVLSPIGFRSFVTRVRRDIALATRFGAKAARHEITPVGAGPVARFPLERTEADFKYMTAFVVDDRTKAPLGVPYLMAAVDCYSGCVAGWDIGFDPPSYVSAARCLRHLISFKDTSAYVNDDGEPIIRNPLPCNSVPFQFILDNDQAFHSKHFRQSAQALGCHVDYLKPGDPSSKGKIERLFGTLGNLLDGLDGKKVKLVAKLKPEHDPAEFAKITLSDLRKYVAKAFADVHHEGEEPGTYKRRIDLWYEGLEIRLPRPVPPHGDLVELVGGYETRKADRRGVRLFGLRYNSSDLAAYRAGFEKNPWVEVRYDPDDISKVWVVDRKKGISFAIPCVRSEYVLPEVDLPGGRREVIPLTLHQHRVITRRAKQMGGSGIVRFRRLLEARAELFALGREMMARTKGRGYRQRVSRFFGPHVEKAAEVSRRRFDPEESQRPLAPPSEAEFDAIEDEDDEDEDSPAPSSAKEFVEGQRPKVPKPGRTRKRKSEPAESGSRAPAAEPPARSHAQSVPTDDPGLSGRPRTRIFKFGGKR